MFFHDLSSMTAPMKFEKSATSPTRSSPINPMTRSRSPPFHSDSGT
jgi:hypothetical protein